MFVMFKMFDAIAARFAAIFLMFKMFDAIAAQILGLGPDSQRRALWRGSGRASLSSSPRLKTFYTFFWLYTFKNLSKSNDSTKIHGSIMNDEVNENYEIGEVESFRSRSH